MDLEEFKKKHKPKKASSLDDYKDEIFNLLNEKYSHENIAKYIRSEGTPTTRQNVTRWIKRNLGKEKIDKFNNSVEELKNKKTDSLESFFSKNK